jgi:hypothetical protein
MTGAFIAQTFVGATAARAFLFDRENSALLCAFTPENPTHSALKSHQKPPCRYPSPVSGSQSLTGLITEASSAGCSQLNDYAGAHNPSQLLKTNIYASLPQALNLTILQVWTRRHSNRTITCHLTSLRPPHHATWLTPHLTRALAGRGFWREF